MTKINSPPIKTKDLKATVAIDSIHISIKMNRYDLQRFCEEGKYIYKNKSSLKYQRSWLIFLADGKITTATYHFSSKTVKFQIGELLNYSINNRYEFIQNLCSYFSDREMTIKRLDIAVDINKKRDDLIIKNISNNSSRQRFESTTYDNTNNHVFIAYDKSANLKIFSTDLSRLELRLKKQLSSWKVEDFISNENSYIKLVKKIDYYFKNKVEIYSNDRLTQYTLDIKIDSTLIDFIAFVHGDDYKYKDHFRIKDAIRKRDKFFAWMRENKLIPSDVNLFAKGRRAAICKNLGFDAKTFKKAVSYYKGNSQF